MTTRTVARLRNVLHMSLLHPLLHLLQDLQALSCSMTGWMHINTQASCTECTHSVIFFRVGPCTKGLTSQSSISNDYYQQLFLLAILIMGDDDMFTVCTPDVPALFSSAINQ